MTYEYTTIANELIEGELTIQDIKLLDDGIIEALEFIRSYKNKDRYSQDAQKKQFTDAKAVALDGLNDLIEYKNSLLDEQNKVNDDIKQLKAHIIKVLDSHREKLLKEFDEVVKSIYDAIKQDEANLQSLNYMKLVQFANERLNTTKKGIFEGMRCDNIKVNPTRKDFEPFWILNMEEKYNDAN